MTDGLVHCVEKGGWYPTISMNSCSIDIQISLFYVVFLSVVYRDEERMKDIRLFILSSGVEASVVCEIDGRGEAGIDLDRVTYKFSWP